MLGQAIAVRTGHFFARLAVFVALKLEPPEASG